MQAASGDRALEIDGIRGWASFSVLLYHTFHEMFTRLLPWINSAWLAPLFAGRLAVCVFFVLSGDALSTAFFAHGASTTSSVDRLLVRRYTRLTIPIVMSCVLVYALRLGHADLHVQASGIINRPDWLGALINFQFSSIGFLRYSLLGVYTHHVTATSYNPFLWTMGIEMLGSLLVFLSCYLWPRLRHAQLVLSCMALALFAFNSFLCLFFAGMVLGHLRAESFYERQLGGKAAQTAVLVAFVLLMLLLVVAYGHRLPLFFDLAVAVALVFILYSQKRLRRFLRGGLSTWLGDISFPMYLVQFAVIISLESWLMIEWNSRRADPMWLPWIGTVAVLATLAVAVVFRRVEKSMLATTDKFVLRILRRN